MNPVHRMYVQLLMYDLPSAEHEGMRLFLRSHGEEGREWIRVQRSIVLLKTLSKPDELRKDLQLYTAGHILIVDVSSTIYNGTAKQAVWDWLRSARAESAALHEKWAKAEDQATRDKINERMRQLPADDPVRLAHEARETARLDREREIATLEQSLRADD